VEHVVVEREKLLTADAAIGLAFAIVVLAGANLLALRLERPLFGAVFTVAIVMLLIVAWRRYLRRIEFDVEGAVITARSVLPFFKFAMPLATLDAVYTTRNIALTGGAEYNVVVRRRGAVQPLLLEVRTANEHRAVQRLLAAIPAELRNASA
jgi:hypothetical protein